MQMLKINSKVKEETLKALKIEAEKEGRTESGMIRFILERYLSVNHMHQGGVIQGKEVPNNQKAKDMTEFFNERNKNK